MLAEVGALDELPKDRHAGFRREAEQILGLLGGLGRVVKLDAGEVDLVTLGLVFGNEGRLVDVVDALARAVVGAGGKGDVVAGVGGGPVVDVENDRVIGELGADELDDLERPVAVVEAGGEQERG